MSSGLVWKFTHLLGYAGDLFTVRTCNAGYHPHIETKDKMPDHQWMSTLIRAQFYLS